MQNDIEKTINTLKELIDIIEKELPERYRLETFKILAPKFLPKKYYKAQVKSPAVKETSTIPHILEGTIDFGEFVRTLKEEPKNNIERLTILVYYLTRYVSPDTKYVNLNKELVEHYFIEVGWRVPANLGRDLNRAIREKRYLARSEKGIYLVKPGKEYVEKLVAGEGVKEYGKL